MIGRKTANYKVVADQGGYRFIFYCDVSDAYICTTKRIYNGVSVEAALLSAWEQEGSSHFNHCHKCGKWVMDAVYNAEVLECVECAPYEAEPKFCKYCGTETDSSRKVCIRCGRRLVYEGSVVNDENCTV